MTQNSKNASKQNLNKTQMVTSSAFGSNARDVQPSLQKKQVPGSSASSCKRHSEGHSSQSKITTTTAQSSTANSRGTIPSKGHSSRQPSAKVRVNNFVSSSSSRTKLTSSSNQPSSGQVKEVSSEKMALQEYKNFMEKQKNMLKQLSSNKLTQMLNVFNTTQPIPTTTEKASKPQQVKSPRFINAS
jgi:hypothetical protein